MDVISGDRGERPAFSANIVGESGTALLEYHDGAVKSYRETMGTFFGAGMSWPQHLPPIKTRTRDMYECARVHVKSNGDP